MESSSEESTSKAKKKIILTEDGIPGAKLVQEMPNFVFLSLQMIPRAFMLQTQYKIPPRFGTGELHFALKICLHYN